jgi:NaMN:DMB phosphoribosyltransferase
MRSYPRNSPQAAARIVALVLVSHGHVCRSEIEALQRLDVERELGLAPDSFAEVLRTLCEDLLLGAYGSGSLMCSVDDAALAALLAEVDDPGLQGKVLRLAGAAAAADRHLADAEDLVVAAARRHWAVGVSPMPSAAPAAALQPL